MSGDPGVRAPQSATEQRLKLAARLDTLFARYGWDIEVYQRQPRWLITALSTIIDMGNEASRQSSSREERLARLMTQAQGR